MAGYSDSEMIACRRDIALYAVVAHDVNREWGGGLVAAIMFWAVLGWRWSARIY